VNARGQSQGDRLLEKKAQRRLLHQQQQATATTVVAPTMMAVDGYNFEDICNNKKNIILLFIISFNKIV
jgi:hypothetical protein